MLNDRSKLRADDGSADLDPSDMGCGNPFCRNCNPTDAPSVSVVAIHDATGPHLFLREDQLEQYIAENAESLKQECLKQLDDVRATIMDGTIRGILITGYTDNSEKEYFGVAGAIPGPIAVELPMMRIAMAKALSAYMEALNPATVKN